MRIIGLEYPIARDHRQLPERAAMNLTLRWTFLAIVLALPAAALAHHGWSEYDSSKPLAVSGVVKESGYEHPHGHVHLQAGEKTWFVVLAPPSRMSARGLPAGALKAGAQAEVVGYANRNKAEEMRAERITVGGKTIELR
jgi:hypothetical protein